MVYTLTIYTELFSNRMFPLLERFTQKYLSLVFHGVTCMRYLEKYHYPHNRVIEFLFWQHTVQCLVCIFHILNIKIT